MNPGEAQALGNAVLLLFTDKGERLDYWAEWHEWAAVARILVDVTGDE